MTRSEHLAWCKERALAELDGHPQDGTAICSALASMFSDLRKHPDTAAHIGIELLGQELVGGFIRTRADAKRQIEGFQ